MALALSPSTQLAATPIPMKKVLSAILGASLLVGAALAQNEPKPATEALVRQLLEETNVRAMLDQMIPQIRSMSQTGFDQALAGQPITDAERAIIQRSLDKVSEVIQEELSWERLEPLYVEIYTKALTEDEVQGMIDFYRTPAGKAVLTKLPAITQQAMTSMQARMGSMTQKLQRIQEETMAELSAARSPVLEP